MQVGGAIVDWKEFTAYAKSGGMEFPLAEDWVEDIDHSFGDSLTEYEIISTGFQLLRKKLTPAVRSRADNTVGMFLQSEKGTGHLDLKSKGGGWFASLSPATCAKVTKEAQGLDYEALQKGFESILGQLDGGAASKKRFVPYLKEYLAGICRAAEAKKGFAIWLNC